MRQRHLTSVEFSWKINDDFFRGTKREHGSGNSIQGAGIHGENCGTVRKASKFMCLTHSEAKEYQNVKSLEQRNAYCRALQGDGWLMS